MTAALDHLLAELRWLELVLRREVHRLRAAKLLVDDDEFRGLYIPDAQVDALLRAPSDAVVAPHAAEAAELRARLDAADTSLPLPRLARLFGLGAAERAALVVALAPEIDLRYATLFAYVQNDVTRKAPSVDLVTRLVGDTLEERVGAAAAFAAGAALRANELVRVEEDPQDRDPPLLARFVKADERIVDFVLARPVMDARLAPLAQLHARRLALDELGLGGAARRSLADAAAGTIVLLHGAYGSGRRTAAASACGTVVAADLGGVLRSDLGLPRAVALLLREALLADAGLYLSGLEQLLRREGGVDEVAQLVQTLRGARVPVFLGSEESWHPAGSGFAGRFRAVELPVPSASARRRLWAQAVPAADDAALEAVAGKFALTPGRIRDAARDADAADAAALHAVARAHSSGALQRLARKLEPVYGWDDIVLPPQQLEQLHDVCASLAYRHVVHERWGFGRRLSLGRGLHALFTGPSGTGKTMAAEIIATELQLDIYKIDLSTVVSKYIGETEERLRRIFDEAEASNAILFFDEADALFGKRSEVKDAHDRYANIEVAYLLQKMEEYAGMVILASNLSRNIDEAFARRMDHTVDFPSPDADHRLRIWRGVFPAETPLGDDVDLQFLARQFELAGGNIRNVAIAAAFRAAEDGGVVRMEHLIRATAREYAKLNKLPSRTDFAEHFGLLRPGE